LLTTIAGTISVLTWSRPPGGQTGQIICFDHEVGANYVIADSFAEWLAELANEFRTGTYRVNDAGALVLAAWE
jgi:cell wall assembly regulator SMI1